MEDGYLLIVVKRLISVEGHFVLGGALLGGLPFFHRYKAYPEMNDDQKGT